MMRGVYVGHDERSGATIFLTPEGVSSTRNENRENVGTRPWDHEFGATCDAVPWQLKFD